MQRVTRYYIKPGRGHYVTGRVTQHEEVILFNLQLLILCLPAPSNFLLKIEQPLILWFEQPIQNTGEMLVLQVASNCIELKTLLQQTLQV